MSRNSQFEHVTEIISNLCQINVTRVPYIIYNILLVQGKQYIKLDE